MVQQIIHNYTYWRREKQIQNLIKKCEEVMKEFGKIQDKLESVKLRPQKNPMILELFQKKIDEERIKTEMMDETELVSIPDAIEKSQIGDPVSGPFQSKNKRLYKRFKLKQSLKEIANEMQNNNSTILDSETVTDPTRNIIKIKN